MDLMVRKTVMAVIIGGCMAAAAASAQAQSVSIGHAAAVTAPGAVAAEADQMTASIEDGNLTVTGAASGGARVGDVGGQAGVNGTLSVPVPTSSHPVPVPTPEQMAAPVIAPIAAPVQIAKKLFGL